MVLQKNSFVKVINSMLSKFSEFQKREQTYINHQRLIIMECYSSIICLGTLSNILGFSGSFAPFFTITNSILFGSIAMASIAYITKKINIAQTISCMTCATQFIIAIDNIYSALMPSLPNYLMVILINMLILSANIIIPLATYLTRTAQIMTYFALTAYLICVIITNSSALKDYFFLLFLILSLISILGFRIAKNAERLENENKSLKKEEAEMLQILRLNKKQFKAYISLAKQEQSPELTKHLLDLLGETSQKNLIANVLEFIRKKNAESHKIEMVFPELTPSEIEICQLILRNKKLGEICSILNKTESNINTQRANIRKKLELKPTDNLQKILAERMNLSPYSNMG